VISFSIDVKEDGSEICAIIGEMPEEVAVGFGKTVEAALRALLLSMPRDLLNATCGKVVSGVRYPGELL
jgi:hypothetical protein